MERAKVQNNSIHKVRAQEYSLVEYSPGDYSQHSFVMSFHCNVSEILGVSGLEENSKAAFSSSFKELVYGLLKPEFDKRFTLKSKQFNGVKLDRINLAIAIKARWAEFAKKKKKCQNKVRRERR